MELITSAVYNYVMRLFKVQYQIDTDSHLHSRYYHADSESTALEMFHETVESGSLSGETPEIIKVVEALERVNISKSS